MGEENPPGPPVKLHKTRSDLLVILPIVIICGLWYYNSVKRKRNSKMKLKKIKKMLDKKS